MLQKHQSIPAAKQFLDSLDPRLRALVSRAAKQAGASYAFLLLCDESTSEFRNVAWYGQEHPREEYVAVARWVLSKGKPLFLQGGADAKEIVGHSLDEGAVPLICAPIMSNSSVRGVLIVGYPTTASEEFLRSLPLLEALAELAGAFLENETLQRDLYRREEQVRDLIRETLDAQEGERERICLEVHDGVAQTLVSAFQYLQALETTSPEGSPARQLLLKATALVKQAIQEAREVINSLKPSTVKDLGLIPTLRQEMRRLEQELGWQIDFQAGDIRFPEDIETGLYRIVREAIINVQKHAYRRLTDVRRIRVAINCTEDKVQVEVRDWGAGFSYDRLNLTSASGRFGLLSMRKRAELLRGTCDIQSSPGEGTTVRVEIPLSTYRE